MALVTCGYCEGNSATLPLFNSSEVFSSTSDQPKVLAEIFSITSDLDDPDISLAAFLSTATLKLHNIPVSPKLVKKVMTNLDL